MEAEELSVYTGTDHKGAMEMPMVHLGHLTPLIYIQLMGKTQ